MSDTRFYITGGSLRADTPSYVERNADRELFDALSAGQFCYVLTARQTGKSSLMVRTAARLREAGIQTVGLDLTALGQNLGPEQWYYGLLGRMGERLGLEEELETFWFSHAPMGPLRRFMAALEQVVLAHEGARGRGGEGATAGQSAEEIRADLAHSPAGSVAVSPPRPLAVSRRVVIFLDEIDAVRSLPFSTDELFAAIRECYNRRAEEPA